MFEYPRRNNLIVAPIRWAADVPMDAARYRRAGSKELMQSLWFFFFEYKQFTSCGDRVLMKLNLLIKYYFQSSDIGSSWD